jgi:hypothetical protein
MKKVLPLLPALALVLLTGCPSFSTMGTARTLPKGKGQFFVAPGATVLQDFQQQDDGSYQSFGLPSIEFGGRYGVTDRVEVGAKVWMVGVEIDSKFQLARSETPEAGVDVALAPGISVYPFRSGDTDATYAYLHLPLLVGINAGGSQLVLGPRVSDLIIRGGGQDLNVVMLGGSLGYAWKIGDGFRLLPEVSMAYPIHVTENGTSSTLSLEPKGAMIQASLGFLFGGD